ncbi:hypothetical protein F0562_022238 [Nyssa sinensis]|uniref:Subtilisin-like protease SBT4.15 n=1 Tax=Nyssa sinensis TaxID=561372 RepID=A0A5J5BNE6_9ASTE|nr:hypothetical protein F0562_022238 [Nyssa sinensis]
METSAKLQLVIFSLLLLLATIHGAWTHDSSHTERKAYIVYMGDAPKTRKPAAAQHHHLLSWVIGDEKIARQSRIVSYGKSFNAFAANLLPHEAKRLQKHEKVVSVFPSTVRKLHTTRSWNFLGMPLSVKRNSHIESDIIVGLLDSGIYIDAPSFDDKGFGPPPSKWKGTCQLGANFTGCNNKVIGARFYEKGRDPRELNRSPVDDEGHGTHTSSTVAGVTIAGASLYGLGKGTARGGVPLARIAMYKVCWALGCNDMDVLGAMDDAIHDGVDLLSVSLGGESTDFFADSLAIGSFHAMKKGILTSCSAGNDGPDLNSVENVAPWIMTVAASGMDRQFRTRVMIGNGMETSGVSINTFAPKKAMYPMTSGAKAVNHSAKQDFYTLAKRCDWGTLDEKKVKGKIVLCEGGGDDTVIKEMGGLGMIMSSDDHLDTGFTFLIPAANVDTYEGDKIDKYINSTKNPKAFIYKSRSVNVAAPFVASFSSRGPSAITPIILKPDITAPGVDILAAYTKLASVTGYKIDKRIDVYNIISGTSMSCPHASAAAAYVKSFHPDWSPAAVKSALMTTASEMKIKDEFAELAYGAGQINPVRAVHPGLVYDLATTNYIRFLCNQGYTGTALSIVVDEHVNCSRISSIGGHDDLNYPTVHLMLENPNSSISATFHRTVTNVGYGKSVYKAIVKAPEGIKISVVPDTLAFNQVKEKQSFKVELKGPPLKNNISVLSASLEWSDKRHIVKSPILVFLPPLRPY